MAKIVKNLDGIRIQVKLISNDKLLLVVNNDNTKTTAMRVLAIDSLLEVIEASDAGEDEGGVVND